MTDLVIALVVYLAGLVLGACGWHLWITGRYHLTPFRHEPAQLPQYRLADDITVPIDQVVTDAEHRVDADQRHPGRPP